MMRKILKVLAVIMVVFIFAHPFMAMAATWGGVENFNSYSAGALGAANGGSGWSGAWGHTTDWQVVTSGCYEGAACINNPADTDAQINRSLSSAVSDATVQIAVKAQTAAASADLILHFDVGASEMFQLRETNSGNDYTLRGNSDVAVVSSYDQTIFYEFQFDFGGNQSVCTSSQVRARAKPAGGSYGSWTSCVDMESSGSIDTIVITGQNVGATSNDSSWVDDIKDGGVVAAAVTSTFQIPFFQDFIF